MDASHLEGLPLFGDLSKNERRRIAQHADEIDLPAGEELVHEGATAYEFFMIEQGSAEVRHGDEHVADLGTGDFFGEMGALHHAPRNASVVTTSPMIAIVMTAHDLRALSQAMPAIGEQLRAAIEKRSRTALH